MPCDGRYVSLRKTRTRHELARTIALEDGEPWRLAEVAAAKSGVESAGGVAPADVDRLRGTAAGTAKLSRALAQGEVRMCVCVCMGVHRDCGSFVFPAHRMPIPEIARLSPSQTNLSRRRRSPSGARCRRV